MRSLIIDCDPGCDDAIAILLALRNANVKGITTVSGNVPVSQATENALMTVAIANTDTPVYQGASQSFNGTRILNNVSHGNDGLGGITRLSHSRSNESVSACDFLLECVTKDDWVIALGPLTNLAEALARDSEWGKRIGGISIMGGSTSIGNITPVAEFNVFADPHAAAKVYTSGAKLKMCGLNLTHQFQVLDETVTLVSELATAKSTFVANLLEFLLNRAEKIVGSRWAPLHDPCAVLAVTHPKLFEFEACSVTIETQGTLTSGMTVIDQRTTRPRLIPNTLVATKIDTTRAVDVLVDSLET
ncbi:MAG: nucleoside hydrolase [Gammaproteobacteria bacterium]|nr:nucleoside hydrolase [Gammaproteobacteria bacterium]